MVLSLFPFAFQGVLAHFEFYELAFSIIVFFFFFVLTVGKCFTVSSSAAQK